MRIPKSGSHDFSLFNDPKAPHTIVWADADLKAFAEYKAQRAVFLANRPNEVLTQEHAERQARLQVEFALARIVGVRNWDIEEPGAEGPVTRRLEWPTDKDAILASINEMPPALVQMFVDTVIVAHFPADLRSYAAATGAVIYPNS